MSEAQKNYIFDAEKAMMKMKRMAYEILENNQADDQLVFAGIQGNGSIIADLMANLVQEISGRKIERVSIDLNKQHPMNVVVSPSIDVNDKVVIIIDDVTNSGKTISYGLKPFLEHHPKKIQTLVLVERSYTKFPVRADYVGHSLSTFLNEHIFVEVKNNIVTGAYVA